MRLSIAKGSRRLLTDLVSWLYLQQLGSKVGPPGPGYQPAFPSEDTVSLMSGHGAVLGPDAGKRTHAFVAYEVMVSISVSQYHER